MRQLAGVLLKDVIRYVPPLLRHDASGYLSLCNRTEGLERAPDGSGFRCDWQWTSDLHAPKHLPWLGRWLAVRALADHPIRRRPLPETPQGPPEVSFIIGHRGKERLAHLLATIETIAAQRDVSIECIVVEQEQESTLGVRLPSWVRHIHTPPPAADMPYCRSWAFNVGARHARGNLLILHDNDILVPADYAVESARRVRQGFEVVNLKRFVFYLGREHSDAFLANCAGLAARAAESISQNCEGGASIAITRDAYASIGGMDESFIGWGGEDNEFWARALTLRAWEYAYLPLIHLWHPTQPGKQHRDNPTLQHYWSVSAIPAPDRIATLRRQSRGQMLSPTGWPTKSPIACAP
jgi:hypothetical protein